MTSPVETNQTLYCLGYAAISESHGNCVQVGRGEPTQVGTSEAARLSGLQTAEKRVESDSEVGVGVLYTEQLLSTVDLYPQFLAELVYQAGLTVLAWLLRTPGELPRAAQYVIRRALGEKKAPVCTKNNPRSHLVVRNGSPAGPQGEFICATLLLRLGVLGNWAALAARGSRRAHSGPRFRQRLTEGAPGHSVAVGIRRIW